MVDWRARCVRDRCAGIRPDVGSDVHAGQCQEMERPGWLVLMLQGLVTGAYFPVSELPSFLQILAKLMPQTYAIDLARRLLLSGAEPAPLLRIRGLSDVQVDFLMIVVFALVLPTLGAWCFKQGIHKAQRDGGLSRWA